jgi:hypothetical protein
MDIDANQVMKLFTAFRSYCNERDAVYKTLSKKQRSPNFPEDISENIVRQFIINNEKRCCTWATQKGDLQLVPSMARVEVKCFSSTGPLSFGPDEAWDELYFLDAMKLLKENEVRIYKCSLSFESDIIKSLPMNKNETFEDQCRQKRRPRFKLSLLQKHCPEHVSCVYQGSLEDILLVSVEKPSDYMPSA